MLKKRSSEGYRYPLDGIARKTLAHGEKSLMVEFVLRKDAILPLHSHPHEQTGYLVKGQIRLTIGSESHMVKPGDSWCIKENVQHGAEAIEDAVAVEVFSPLREDYLPE